MASTIALPPPPPPVSGSRLPPTSLPREPEPAAPSSGNTGGFLANLSMPKRAGIGALIGGALGGGVGLMIGGPIGGLIGATAGALLTYTVIRGIQKAAV